MIQSLLLYTLITAFVGLAHAGFGAHWALNPHGRDSGVHVLRAVTTIQVPKTPSPPENRLYLWPGMATQNDGLVQSIIGSFADPGNARPEGCHANPGQWCAFSAVLVKKNLSEGAYTPANECDLLTLDYEYEASSGWYKQTISRDGKVLSSLNKPAGGNAFNYYIEVECQANQTGITPAHTYHNTTITLAKADPEFGATLGTKNATNSPLCTPDKGKTWKVATIHIEAADCNPKNP